MAHGGIVAWLQVVFELHPSFTVPTRPLEQQPFEVTESGWGEFEVVVRLVFSDDAQVRIGTSDRCDHGIEQPDV